MPQPTPPPAAAPLIELDARRLVHELQVHQIELAQQNEDLTLARNEVAFSLRRYVALYESAPVGLVTVDHQGVVRDINAQARALLADGAVGLVGCALLDCVAGGSRDALWQAIRHPPPQGERMALDVTLPTPDGGRARVLHADLQADPAGDESVLIALTDITSRLELEAAREAAQSAAESASRAKSDFLARMSHDLRTPLNAMLGFAHLLTEDSAVMATPGGARGATHIHRAGRHLLALIDDLLDVARIETGGLQLHIEPVNLQLLAADCLVLTEALAEQNQVQVATVGDWQDRWVRADRRRLQQAVLNLLTNAIKYNRPGGSVDLSLLPGTLPAAADSKGVGSGESGLTLRVTDTGLGMTAEQIAGMYQPFNRLGAERGQVEGNGLGLVIARQLVVAMGGELAVSSVPGCGSVFSATLPASVAGALPALQRSEPGERPDEWPGEPSSQRPVRVLYVEDNPVNMELMCALMEARPQAQLLQAEDGQAGLDAARRMQPDLVLLDLQLPRLSGLQVLQALRADPATAKLLCVAVSANGQPDAVARARAAGFDDYLVKPFDPERLLGLVDAVRLQA